MVKVMNTIEVITNLMTGVNTETLNDCIQVLDINHCIQVLDSNYCIQVLDIVGYRILL